MDRLKGYYRYLRGLFFRLGKRGRSIVKWMAILAVCSFLFVALGSMALNRWLNKGHGRDFLANTIADQTGAIVEIGSVIANLPRGGMISSISLKLPLVGGGHEKEPSIKIGEVRMHLSMHSLVYGTFRIKEMLVDGLEIHAERRDGVLWTKGLVDFRASRAPQLPAEQVAVAPPTQPPLNMNDVAALIYKIMIPFRIRLEQVGIKKLSLSFDDVTKGKQTNHLYIGPLDLVTDITAWMRTSNLGFHVAGSNHQNQLKIELRDHGRALIDKTFAFVTDLRLLDLRDLAWEAQTTGLPEDLNLAFKLDARSNYQLIDISQMDVKIGQILKNSGNIKVAFEDGSTERLNLKIEEKAAIHLNALSTYAAPFKIKTSGTLALERLSVDGLVDLKSFATIEKAILPKVSIDFAAQAVSVTSPMANVKNFDAKSELQIIPLKDGGADLAQNGKIAIDLLEITPVNAKTGQTSKGPIMRVSAAKFSSEIAAAAVTDVKAIAIKKLDLNADISEVAVKPPEGGMIKTPIKASMTASTQDFLRALNLNASLDVGALASGSIDLSCKTECQTLSVISNFKIPHIDQLVTLITPALGQAAAKLPVLEGGSFNHHMNVDAQMPKGALSTIAVRAKKARGKIDTHTQLNDLKITHVPSKSVIEGLSFDFKAQGAIEKQTLSGQVAIKSVQTPALPKPLVENRVSLLVKVEELARASLDDLLVEIPSLGTSVKVAAKTELSDTFVPQNVSMDAVATIAPKSIAPGLIAVVASGTAQGSIHVKTPDLRMIHVNGDMSLDHFSLEIPASKEAASLEGGDVPLISVANMNGVFPFKQDIDLDQLKSSAKPMEVTADDAAKASAPEPTLDDRITTYLDKHKESQSMADNRMKSESYAEVRPTLGKHHPITGDRIAFKTLAITDVEIDAELSQQMFSVNQIVFGLLGGKVQSSVQISFDTTLRQARITGQCTELDTRRLADGFPKLKDKMRSFSLFSSSPYIDGTLRLIYDAPSGDIAGGLEVTRIGKDQLRAMLLFVDPEENNPTISTMRKALNVGEVRQVSVPIRNGQIGLDLDVRLFSAPIPTPKMQRFPLSQLVRNFTGTKKDTRTVKQEKTDDEAKTKL